MISLKEQIKNTGKGGIIELRCGGEFVEQLVISKPVTIRSVSSHPTVVSGSPTITIQSKNVFLEKLNIVCNDAKEICLSVKNGLSPNLKDILVKGSVEGLEGEEGDWELPDVLDFGNLEPNKAVKKKLMILCPVPAIIYSSKIPAVKCAPEALNPGFNEIEITIDEIVKSTLIYGVLIIETLSCKLKRKITLIGNTLKTEQIIEHPDNDFLWICPSFENIITSGIPESLPEGTQGQSYEYVLDEAALKCKKHDIQIEGLPTGLDYDFLSLFPAIRGTPSAAGEFELTFTFQKKSLKQTRSSKLKINQKSQSIINTDMLECLPEGTLSAPYEYVLDEASLKCKGYNIRIEGLPEGVRFDNSVLFPMIKGMPEKAGEYDLTFEFQKNDIKFIHLSKLIINEKLKGAN